MEIVRSGSQYRQDPHLWGDPLTLTERKKPKTAYNARNWSLGQIPDGEGSHQNRFFDSLVRRLSKGNMNRLFFAIIIGILLVSLSSCSRQTEAENQPPIISLSPDSISNSPTPTPSLNEPLLIFLDKTNSDTFVALSPSNLSEAKIQLPQDSCVRNWQNAISPHGHWIAIYMNCSNNEVSPEISSCLTSHS